ncbi:uncharacterized protein LOC116286366 isoform X1 [Actinia tenebrosa]|uniref:Uncharacterized protein LOC116286366 isoform X1 n=1 Tax=Actinia tenebrosa TaxID=6105 RepID=A0A6P8H8E1_ACTTE|nr:uncharacterized protein LOC116286366 isoform X1 [Actinia tenebrosa]
MVTKFSCISVVLLLLLLVNKASANDLNTLFGISSGDDDTVLYVTIAFVVLAVVLLICMIICLYWLYKVIQGIIKKRQEEMEERRRWHGGVDDIIDDAQKMVPLPRATNTLEKGYINNSYSNTGIDFVNSRI